MTPINDERPYLLRILREIDAATPVGEHRREIWNEAWRENVTAVPAYFGNHGGIVRVNRKLYAEAHGYEARFLANLREQLAGKYFSAGAVRGVAEFGCGNGQNLLPLKGRLPLLGLDWAESAVRHVRGAGVDAALFDMFHPEGEFDLEGWGVLTVHAMEQLGARWHAFLEFLLEARPAVVIHVEPIAELYDADELLDELALRYHRKRGYLHGYLTHLQASDDVQIIQVERTFVGSLCHEAYSVVVWGAA